MKITLGLMKRLEAFAKSNLAVFLLLAVALNGCSRCENCTLNNNTETLCESEFDSVDQYEDAIADLEAQGATCTTTGGF